MSAQSNGESVPFLDSSTDGVVRKLNSATDGVRKRLQNRGGPGSPRVAKPTRPFAQQIFKEINKTKNLSNLQAEDSGDLTIEQVAENGITINDIAGTMWVKINEIHKGPSDVESSKKKNFSYFPHVRLDKSGGMDLIDAVWYSSKYLWAVVAIATCAFNVMVLLLLNYWVLSTASEAFDEMMQTHSVTAGLQEEAEQALDNKHKNANIAFLTHIKDAGTKTRFVLLASAVGGFELLAVAGLILRMVHLLGKFAFYSKIKSCFGSEDPHAEFKEYKAVDKLCRVYVPLLGTFSALKLAVLIHPSLIAGDFQAALDNTTICGKPARSVSGGVAYVSLKFICVRICCAVAAVSAFGMKCVIIGWRLTHPQVDMGWKAWLSAMGFLNCCIGAVTLEQQLQDRVFLFIFGGEDAVYQPDEVALLKVYRANIMKKIWNTYITDPPQKQYLKAISYMVTLDHFDLQALLLEPSDKGVLEALDVDMDDVVPSPTAAAAAEAPGQPVEESKPPAEDPNTKAEEPEANAAES